MTFRMNWVSFILACLTLAVALVVQPPEAYSQTEPAVGLETPGSPAKAIVPRLIKFSGTLLDAQDRPLAGPVGVTFALHAQQTGGAALWIETQNATPDAHGNYTVLLGANSANGVPAELFVSGEARWLEAQVERQAEQPRVLLVSVPYALKAKDAETLGGRPASAFLTTETLAGAGGSAGTTAAPSSSTALPSSKAQTTLKKAASAPQPATTCASVTSDGTAAVNSIALFSAACKIQSSLMTQAVVNGFPGVNVAGNNAGLLLSGTGTHEVTVTGSTSSGRLGQDATGFFFSSDSNGKVIKFLTNNGTLNEWMRITSAGNVGIGTQTPAAKLDINGNLNLPNTAGPTVGSISLGGAPFVHAFGPDNAFFGPGAGNFTMSGSANTAVGESALVFNTSGSVNAALGIDALLSNTTGSSNTAVGPITLVSNNTGANNTAVGASAGTNITSGNDNTFLGAAANTGTGTAAQLSNATAIGANALVSCSNCMALGGTGTKAVNVGIGTTTPGATLDVNGNQNIAGNLNVGGVLSGNGSNTLSVLAGASLTGAGGALQLNAGTGGNSGSGGVAGGGATLSAGSGGQGAPTTSARNGGPGGLVMINGGFGGNGSPDASPQGAGGAGGNIVLTPGSGGNGVPNGAPGIVTINGNLSVMGTVSKMGGSFKIDHPLDPAYRYLSHSFVESPDMMNIYNGVIVLDHRGEATVVLPDWFEVLNGDFRYQLTSIGSPQPRLHVAKEITGNRFQIAGGRSHGKVSWQVTGIRHDVYANAHRIPVEEQKTGEEVGRYLHPELFGKPESFRVGLTQSPERGSRENTAQATPK